jgi:hypothetical protein
MLVERGDKKGTQSRMREGKIWTQVMWNLQSKAEALTRPSSPCMSNFQARPLVREGVHTKTKHTQMSEDNFRVDKEKL